MRVAHVISTPVGIGGAERVVRALVRGGLERGHEVRLLNPFARGAPTDHAIGRGLPPHLYEAKACEHIWQLPALHRWLSGQVDRFTPDVVHAHLFHAQVAVASLRRGPRERRVLTHHHGSALRIEGKGYERWLDEFTGDRYDRIVAVSDHVARFLTSVYGYDPSKVVTILNGWEGEPPTERTSQEDPTIVAVANFRFQKGHHVLIDAFSDVVSELPDARLVLVGDGELRSELEGQVDRAGLGSRVRFVGAVDDVWPFLRDADVFALASVYESLGIVVMEAMAAGLPIVATRVGGVPELITHGVTGELVPPSDPRALGQALLGLLLDQKRRDRLGAAARVAVQEVSVERMVERYMVLYEELVDGE